MVSKLLIFINNRFNVVLLGTYFDTLSLFSKSVTLLQLYAYPSFY